MSTTLWSQFRRLFTGTIVETLQERGIEARKFRVDFSTDSRFDVPRFDNYMRFVGEARVELEAPLAASMVDTLRRDLEAVWPALVSCLDIPVGDRLTVDRVRIQVVSDQSTLRIVFDLVAD